MYILENELLKIVASNYGAELHHIVSKKTNTEFLWNRDSTFWKYSSPTLFPIVGKLKNGHYTLDNKTYSLPQHGLARINNFDLISSSKDKASFGLCYSNDTLNVYPFKFNLLINYELIENNIKITYIVKNLDNKTIYFSLGAHPAFFCPILDNENIEDYYFEFNKKETASSKMLDIGSGLISHETKPFLKNESIINLSSKTFINDALIFENLLSNSVTLKSKNHNKSISVDFTDFPQLALWSMPKGCPFVCIEPWFGHSDFVDSNGNLKEKHAIQSLNVNKDFICSYTITIND